MQYGKQQCRGPAVRQGDDRHLFDAQPVQQMRIRIRMRLVIKGGTNVKGGAQIPKATVQSSGNDLPERPAP